MSRCPLCDSKLIGESCPVCSSLSVPVDHEADTLPIQSVLADRTLRNRKKAEPPPPMPRRLSAVEERASWYAAAGMSVPEAGQRREEAVVEALPAPTLHPVERGYVAAALVLIANALASALALAFAMATPGFDIASIAVQFVVIVALARRMDLAKFLVLVSAAFLFIKCAAGFAQVGSVASVIASIAPLGLIGAFFLDAGWTRTTAASVGIVAAFAWFGAVVASPPSLRDPRADFAIRGDRFADTRDGFALRAPPGVILYDVRRMAESGKRPGAARAEAGTDETANVEFASADGNVNGEVRVRRLPAAMNLERAVAAFAVVERGSVRDDSLVPLSLRGARGIEAQGWTADGEMGARHLVVARAADGRMLAARCAFKVAGAERICRMLVMGISLEAR